MMTAPDASAQGERTPLAHVETRGSGDIHLVLIPCSGCDWRSWDVFMQRHAHRYTMHAVTLPSPDGQAMLPDPRDATDTPALDRAAQAVAEYVADQQIGPVVLVGHSMGAVVALHVTLTYPDRVTKLILEDWGAVHPASLTLNTEERIAAGRQAAARIRAMSPETFVSTFAPMLEEAIADSARAATYIDMMRAAAPPAAAQITYEMRMLDLRPRLREIDLPVLALFARYPGVDPEVRREQAEATLTGVRDLELVWIDDASHWIHEDHLAPFEDAVVRFIALD